MSIQISLDQHARTSSKEPPRRTHLRRLPGLLLALLPLLVASPLSQHPGHLAISKPGNVAIQQSGGLPPSIAIQKPGHPPAA